MEGTSTSRLLVGVFIAFSLNNASNDSLNLLVDSGILITTELDLETYVAKYGIANSNLCKLF